MKINFNKKNVFQLVILLSAILIFTTSAFVWAFTPDKNSKPSQYRIGTSYNSAMKDEKPVLLLFYTDWCPHCREIMPQYQALSKFYAGRYNFVMLNADSPENSAYSRDYNVRFLPTLYIVNPKTNEKTFLDMNLYGSIDAMRSELDRYLR